MKRYSLFPVRVMFRFQSPLIALLFFMGWGGGFQREVWAQIIPSPTPLTKTAVQKNRTMTLDDAVAIAVENNQELKIARLEVVQAQEALKFANAGDLPILSASGRLFRADSATFSANPGGVVSTAEQGQIQQQTAVNVTSQRQATRAEFQAQLQRLQIQLDRGSDLSQQDTVDQQLGELTNRANASAALPFSGGEAPLIPAQGFSPSTAPNLNSGIRNTVESDLTLSYNILTGGSRSANIRAAKKQLESAQLEVTRLTQDLRLTVANDYYDLQEVRALLLVALSALTNAEQTLNNAVLTEAAGLSTKFEILQAEVQLANAKQNLSLAESLQRSAQRQLTETLSSEPNVDIVPTDAVEPVGGWVTSLPKSIVAAQTSQVSLQQILVSREIQKEQRTIVLSAKRPNLSSFAQLTASASDVEPGTGLNPNDDNFRGNLGYGVGVQVNLNAFDGGEIKAQVQEINENIKILETQYDNQKNQIRLQVESSYTAIERNRENIRTSEGALALAKESLELARLRLKAGIGTQLDVIQAQTDLTQAEGNVIEAILDYNRAIASIARATTFTLPIENYQGKTFQ
jgi:outer membrane factor, OMF family